MTCRCSPAAPQASGNSQITESIDVNDSRPLAAALQALEKKYGLAITYEDPVYANFSDLQDVTPPVVGRPVVDTSHRVFVPKGGEFHFHYAVENGKPVEDTHSLLRRMLTEYAGVGKPAFEVQERTTKYWPEWHVFLTEVRATNGDVVPGAALLDNIINIPNRKRTYTEMFGEILEQVSIVSGYRVMVANYPMNYFYALRNHEADYGADHRPARDALAELLGPSFVWYLFHVPGDQKFFLDIHIKATSPSSAPVPQRFSPLDESGHLINPGPRVSREEAYRHSLALRHLPLSYEHISEIQSALARAGYYQGDPTGMWDSNTVEAMKKFQSANDLPPTGRWDEPSLRKLGVTFTPSVPANIPKPQE